MVDQLNPQLRQRMDFRLMPRSLSRVEVVQTHRFREFLQAPRQPLAYALGVFVGVMVVRRAMKVGFMVGSSRVRGPLSAR